MSIICNFEYTSRPPAHMTIQQPARITSKAQHPKALKPCSTEHSTGAHQLGKHHPVLYLLDDVSHRAYPSRAPRTAKLADNMPLQ